MLLGEQRRMCVKEVSREVVPGLWLCCTADSMTSLSALGQCQTRNKVEHLSRSTFLREKVA